MSVALLAIPIAEHWRRARGDPDIAEREMPPATARGTDQVLGTLGEAYAARRYAQETNLTMKGVLAAVKARSRVNQCTCYSRARWMRASRLSIQALNTT